jgi:hypothetical protein
MMKSAKIRTRIQKWKVNPNQNERAYYTRNTCQKLVYMALLHQTILARMPE